MRYPRYLWPALSRAKLTGADWLREEFTANKLHHSTRGRYHWRRFDRVVNAERSEQFHILGLLDYDNTWDGRPHSYMPHNKIGQRIQDFDLYVAAVVRHYLGRISAWQIWNEPDLHHFWGAQPHPQDYARLLASAYAVIKRIDPRATVVLGGPSGSDPHALGFVRKVVKAGGRFDVMSIQPYRDIPDLQLIHQVIALRKYHKPIWFTEMGWAGEQWCDAVCGTTEAQADRLARLYAVAAFAGVKKVFWYDLRDDGTSANFEDHFGLLEHGFRWKPSFTAYQMSQYYLDHGRFLGVDVLKHEVYAFHIRNHGQTFVILWNNRTGYYGLDIPWSDRSPASVLDWRGDTVAESTNQEVSVAVAPRSVLYIVPSGFRPVLDYPAKAPLPPPPHWPVNHRTVSTPTPTTVSVRPTATPTRKPTVVPTHASTPAPLRKPTAAATQTSTSS